MRCQAIVSRKFANEQQWPSREGKRCWMRVKYREIAGGMRLCTWHVQRVGLRQYVSAVHPQVPVELVLPTAKEAAYDAWRKTQGPGYPDFPDEADVLTPANREHILATWTKYHADVAAYEAWAKKQPLSWHIKDFLKAPW